jgi:hypothetical protein
MAVRSGSFYFYLQGKSGSFSGLKARYIPAQGNALGIKRNNPVRALKGQLNDVRRYAASRAKYNQILSIISYKQIL